MTVSVALFPGGNRVDAEPEVTFALAGAEPMSDLRFESRLGLGVRLVIDPASPQRWRAVRIATLNNETEPLIRALVGADATQHVSARLQELRSGALDGRQSAMVEPVAVDPSGADPWLRVATADALDRWLQLPLDQSLVDAERGIARSQAAMTLPEGAARQAVIADALDLARRASRGLAGYLGRLSLLNQPPPVILLNALKQLVDGYEALIGEVTGPDRDLRRVVTRWAAVGDHGTDGPPDTHANQMPGCGPGRLADRASLVDVHAENQRRGNVIDLRQVRARVFALMNGPESAEVSVVETVNKDLQTVLVKVPAFGPVTASSGLGARMLVRLVERGSGRPRSEAVLTLSRERRGPDRRGRLIFSGTAVLNGARFEDVRADVFDALSVLPPAKGDDDAAMLNVRRAVHSLRELRQLIARTRIPSATGRRLRLKRGTREAAQDRVSGPGDLMVAELAAAHQAMKS